MGRTWAVGDIHGTLTAFETLLDLIDLLPGDRLITLGDYVNRGGESSGVLDLLIKLHGDYEVISILGNHDQTMCDAIEQGPASGIWYNWLQMGGVRTLASYEAENATDPRMRIPAKHINFLNNTCRDLYEDDEFIYTHARLVPDLPTADQPPLSLRWERMDESFVPHQSGKTLICGHTSQKDGRVWRQDGMICIDTFAYGTGWLTALEMSSMQVYRANQHGKTEQGPIDDFC